MAFRRRKRYHLREFFPFPAPPLRPPAADMPALLLPPVIGHRCARAEAPENTLAGLRRAAALGARWVEVDVRLTADGVPVLLHDATLERTTSGHGALGETTLTELERCDAGAGETVPTLAAFLTACGSLLFANPVNYHRGQR